MGTLCYIEQDGQMLMLHRNKKPNDMHNGLWVGLGGKFEPGESPEDCVKREVLEESGLTLLKPKLRGILTFPDDYEIEDWAVFLFTASEFTGTLASCDEGELHWVPETLLHTLPMHGGDRFFLKWIREYEGFLSAKMHYQHGRFEGYELHVY